MVCCSVPPAPLSSALSRLLLHYYIAIALRFITLLAGHTMSASPQPSPAPPQVSVDRKKAGDSAEDLQDHPTPPALQLVAES